jgi:hypothetical protein
LSLGPSPWIPATVPDQVEDKFHEGRLFAGMTEDKGFGDRNIRFQEVIMAKITIDPKKIIGTISPHIYGHFTEHIGGVIYDGIWVGGDSPILD